MSGRGGRGRGGGGPQGGARGGRGGSQGGGSYQQGGQSSQGGGGGGGGRGGRGGGGGYQGGGGGYQGGGGGYQGGGGGYQGGGGGYQGGGGGYQGGGGGGYRGGGGGYRGQGGGYQQGGGNRGYQQGGRGGGGGEPQYPHAVFGQGTQIPVPNPDVTIQEDAFVRTKSSSAAQATSQVGKLSLATGGTRQATSMDLVNEFPYRPGFGGIGTKITLWANYFTLEVKPQQMFKYAIEVKHQAPPADDVPASGKGKGKMISGEKEAKGKKLQRIIESALSRFSGDSVASEFKAHVITLKKLDIPESGIIQVEYTEPGRDRIEHWNVNFIGPTDVNVDQLMTYLNDMRDPVGDAKFPRFQDEVDAIGVILGKTARLDPNAVAIGRGRFFATDAGRAESAPTMPRGTHLTILRGYFQSVRPATGRLLLNANVTHGVFRYACKLDELFRSLDVARMDQVANMSSYDLARLNDSLRRAHRYLNKARLRITMLPGMEVVERVIAGLAAPKDGFGDEEPPQFDFDSCQSAGPANLKIFFRRPASVSPGVNLSPEKLQYNRYITVEDYYKRRYNRTANKANPLINVGTRSKPIYMLAELCEVIPGQPMRTRLTPEEQDSMIKFACRSPALNAHSITTAARRLLALDNNPVLRAFGISVAKDLVTVTGRELQPPAILYGKPGAAPGQRLPVQPFDGGWLMKAGRVIASGQEVRTWCFLYPSSEQDVAGIHKTASDFGTFLRNNMGIYFPIKPVSGIGCDFRRGEQGIRAAFDQARGLNPKPDFLVVILPDKTAINYNIIKRIGDVEFGVHTVCVLSKKFREPRGQAGYFANVGLKVNLKMGGTNHLLKDEIGLIKAGKTMVVGYDVTHPTNLPVRTKKDGHSKDKESDDGKDALPSMVGLVASINKDLSQWPATAWNNRGGVELLDDKLVDAFLSRLRLWQKHNKNTLPDNIVIFRDGVSEGQFDQVLSQELPHIREACKQAYGPRQPRISLIVSVKRHQTRFFPTDENHIHQRSKSPKEGTVVDRGVTNVRYWDFFLQAHASLQGTARPAHYTVLLDEIFRADYGDNAAHSLEKLTHDMCYLFGRATKAVSICPPAYYADLVCTRARVHKSELFEETESVSGGNDAAINRIKDRRVNLRIADSMYYI